MLLRSKTPLKPIFIVLVIAVLLSVVPTTVFAQSDQQQQTCPDGSHPDENGNCPSEQQQPSVHDQICNALQVRNIATLGSLLLALHLITLGASSAAMLAAAGIYCA